MNPLLEFQSKNVYQLLREFYFENFREYGVDGAIGSEMVDYIWVNKDIIAESNLKRSIKQIFDQTNLQESKTRKEISIIDLFDLSKVTHFVDVGANNLARINEVCRKIPSIEKFTAIDVIPQSKPFRSPEISNYIQIDPGSTDYPIKSHSCDFINLEFVLHHFKSEELIKSQLKTFKRVLKPGGNILLWEESFEESINLDSLIIENQGLGILTSKILTEKFYKLSLEERMEFIKVNDWIINVNIDHMQWTGEWKMWGKWVEIFQNEGFMVNRKLNLGLRVNGRLKQGVHVLGLFSSV